MGLASSQARLLSLTARQSNVEYEGQQINQQRINLSNQTAVYNNQSLNIKVPTPPSVTDFTSLQYSYTDAAGNNCAITNLLPITDKTKKDAGFNYYINYDQSTTNYGTPTQNTATSKAVTFDGSNYKIGSTKLTKVDETASDYNKQLVTTLRAASKFDETTGQSLKPENFYSYTDSDNKVHYFSDVEMNAAINKGDTASLKDYSVTGSTVSKATSSLVPTYNSSTGNYEIDGVALTAVTDETLESNLRSSSAYENNTSSTTTKTGVTEDFYTDGSGSYYSKIELDAALAQAGGGFVSPFTTASSEGTTSVEGKKAYITIGDDGRWESIRFDTNEDGFIDEKDAAATKLTANSVKDEDAYEDAMNQYEYDKALYEKELQDINAKLSVVQAQDKKLELQLKQLDTEQEAIQTEKDSVKKVADKNIEVSFKTFG